MIDPNAEYEVTIKADYGDYDCTSKVSTIPGETLLELMPLMQAVRRIRNGNWDRGYTNVGYQDINNYEPLQRLYPSFSIDQFKGFDVLIPYYEFGVHTIVSISYCLKPERIEVQ